MQKSLSIIIPAYNEARHIKVCLDAIAAQSQMPDEVIVVDNNCTDDTIAIASQYSFVRIIHEPKQGRVFARDRGFNAATCDIIGRIDADTILPPDWTAQVKGFYSDEVHYKTYAYTGGAFCYNVRLPYLNSWILSQIAFRANRFILGHYILFGSNMALPRHLWRAVRHDMCLRNDIHEDLDLSIHMHQRGYSITYESGLIVGIEMRRIGAGLASELHENLMLWPQTLQAHGNRRWVYGWVGAKFLYFNRFVPPLADWIALRVGQITFRRRVAKRYANVRYVEE